MSIDNKKDSVIIAIAHKNKYNYDIFFSDGSTDRRVLETKEEVEALENQAKENLKLLNENNSPRTTVDQGHALTENNKSAQNRISTGKRAGTAPWAQSSLTDVSNKHPNFCYRWVNTSITGRVDQMLDEGWVFADKSSQPLETSSSLIDGEGKINGSVVRKREMVLMMSPREIADPKDGSRRAHFKKRQMGAEESLDAYRSSMPERVGSHKVPLLAEAE